MEIVVKLAVVIALVIAWTVLNRRVFKDMYSPFMVLLVSWIGPFLLRWFSLTYNERPWSESFIIVSLLITIGLVVPALASRLFMPSQPRLDDQLRGQFELLGTAKAHAILALVFIPTFAIYVYTNFITNPQGIVALAALRGIEFSGGHHKWGGEGIGIILTLPMLALAPLAHLSYRCSPKRWRRYIPLAIAWLPICGFLLKLSRSEAVAGLIYIGLAEIYFRRFISAKPTAARQKKPLAFRVAILLVSVTGGALAFNTMLKIREGYALQDRGGIASLIGFRPNLPTVIASPLAEFYGYYALPLQNFANFYADYTGGYNPGVGFLRPIYSLTGQSDIAKQRIERIDYAAYLDISAMNTKSFPAVLYAEGGLLGVLLVPWVYSALVSAAYIRLRRRPTPTRIAHYGLLVGYAWIWLFSTNGFVLLTVYIFLGTATAVGLAIRMRARARSLHHNLLPSGPGIARPQRAG